MGNFLRENSGSPFSDKETASAFSSRNTSWSRDVSVQALRDRTNLTIVTNIGFGIQGFGNTPFGGYTTTQTVLITPWLVDKE